MSSQIGTVVASGKRSATVTRATKETQITVKLALDGTGETRVESGVGFFDHLMSAMAHHALFDLEVTAAGDLVVDEHHTVEDVALVFGAALAECLGDRSGIVRFGDSAVPMDESVATSVVDVGGRPYAVVDLPFKGKRAGKLPLELIEHVFESIARAGGVTLNVKGRGKNDHHLAEAAFKSFGRALCAAVTVDPRRAGRPASTKGTLG
jgi:imidazoleglycerol-phosphate dehydratase